MHLRYSTRHSCARAKLVEALEDRRLFASAVSIADVTLDEGNTGSTTFNFTVVRGGDTGPGGLISFATQTGTATATDFTPRSGNISFAPGENQKTISITVKGDADIEADETFTVVLTGSSTVSVVKGEGIGTIVDDDAPIAPNISVSVQGGSTINDGQTAPLDFGSLSQGAAGAPKILTVKNTGKANLTLSGLTVPTGYTVTGDLAGTLAPGTSDSFTVTLSAATAGTFGGSISFATNVTGKNPFNFPVTGIVGAAGKPEVSATIGAAAIKDGQLTPVDFGAVSQGNGVVSKDIVVKNDGTANLSLSDLTLPTGFTLTGELEATLAPGESDSFTITMPASTLGTFGGAVSFKTNDASESTFNFPITGTVNAIGAPEISVSLDNTTAIFDGQAGAIDFGSVVQGAAGVSRTFTVSNLGTGTLSPATPTLPAGYSITESLVQSLGVGESDSFTITSNSGTVGAARGELSIVTNDANENPFNFNLTGSVNLPQTPEISIAFDDDATDTIVGILVEDESGQELDFGSTLIEEAGESRTFTVTNAGTAPLTATLGALPTGYEIVEPLSESIAAGESDTFTLRILATASLGRQAGTLSITSNDSDESPFSISIGGSVVSPETGTPTAVFEIAAPAISGQALDFGARPASSASKVFDVVVKNDGEGSLELGQVVLPSGFTISGTAPTSIAAGESATLKIAFSATSAGTFGGTAILPTNDPQVPAFELTLAGIATSGSGSGGEISVISVTGTRVPTAVVSGDNADNAALTVKVRNTGTTEFNGSLVLAINASKDDKLDAGDGSALFTVTKKARIRPGQTYTIKANTPLKNAPEGDVQLLATATAGNTVSTLAGPGLTVAGPFVNLQSSLSPVPKKPLKFGKKASLSVGLENAGNTATAATPADYTLIVSTSNSADDAVFETTASGKISLKPGARKTQKLNFTIPSGEFAAGRYFMLVKVNAELNESNGDIAGIIPFSIE